jgi:hypothetical protein
MLSEFSLFAASLQDVSTFFHFPICWPLQSWFQEVQRLSAFHFRLPPPRLCVRSHHPGIVEPFVNREVQLRAVVFDCA